MRPCQNTYEITYKKNLDWEFDEWMCDEDEID